MAINKKIGQTTAHTDTAELISPGISVGNLISVKILDREIVAEGQNPTRMLIAINVQSKDTWIKFQPAAMDNDKKGILLQKGETLILEVENMYFGEISAIADLATSDVYVTAL